MIQTSSKSLTITYLYLKDKDLSNLSLEEVVDLYESTHEEVLKILQSKEQPQKLKTVSKSKLGL